MKTLNRRELQLKTLINLGYTYMKIDKQLVKKKKSRQLYGIYYSKSIM